MYKFLLFLVLISVSCKYDKEKSIARYNRKPSIVGKWKVVAANILPFEHISYCKNLGLNSIFDFDQTGKLSVFEDSTKSNCNQHQTYSFDSSGIYIIEFDMTFKYDVIKLTDDSLVYHIDKVPSYLFEEDSAQVLGIGRDIRPILEEGTTVRLIRIKGS